VLRFTEQPGGHRAEPAGEGAAERPGPGTRRRSTDRLAGLLQALRGVRHHIPRQHVQTAGMEFLSRTSVEICDQATYFNGKKKYDGLLPTEMQRLKLLEDENANLRKLVADVSLDRDMLQDVIRRKL
jgi:hypothetical protein